MSILYGRKDRLLKEKRHDVYQERHKWPEPTLCPDCGALFINGHWTWSKTLAPANQATCPACRRIGERCPAGYIEVKGPFFNEHRTEILNLIRNIESQEKEGHPLERIMALSLTPETVLVTTTGLHLARRIGEALTRAYAGNLSFDYAVGEHRIRVHWER